MSRLLLILAGTCSYCAVLATAGEGKPPALVAAERARSATVLRTGKVSGQIETFPGDKLHYEAFTLGLAREQGLMANTILKTARGADGATLKDLQWVGILNTLKKDEHLWWHPSGTTSAYVLPADSPVAEETPDVRSIGLNPWCDNAAMYERMLRDAADETGHDLTGLEHLPGTLREIGLRYEETLRTNPTAVKFDERVEDGVHVVTANIDNATLRWWIDPNQGWNPVRTAVWQDGTLLSETRITNRERDGAWFPEDVNSFSPQYRQGQEPFQVTSVFKAAFNRPDDPSELTPRDIGLQVGMRVFVADGRTTQTLYWDGQQAVPRDDYERRVERGELCPGPSVLDEAAAERGGSSTQPMWQGAPAPAGAPAAKDAPVPIRWKTESDWERYTRLFIEKYKLDEDQTQKAWSILRSAQALADSHLMRHRDEWSELERRLGHTTSGSEADPARTRAALEQRKAKLLAPLDEIFEKQLKARLDKLPTRAQRRTADGESAPPGKTPRP